MLVPQPEDLASLAPYTDAECVAAAPRVISNPAIRRIAERYFPQMPFEMLLQRARTLKNILDFQGAFIDPLLAAIEKTSSRGVTLSGLQHLSKSECYLFLSNHRDIVLDSALFTSHLYRHGFVTPKICLGDNLLVDSLVVDLVKMNKGVTVRRSLSQRELLRWSLALSEIIYQNISSKTDSVWIAQQEGRSKDGKDETHPGVLKMLALRGSGTVAERLRDMHVIPIAISYEYDTSDVEKAIELHTRETTGTYQKKPNEDLSAIMRGFTKFKGGIHIEIGEGIEGILSDAQSIPLKSDQVRFIAESLDKRIRAQYRNWPTNFIAYDELHQTSTQIGRYTAAQKEEFLTRLKKRLAEAELSDESRACVRTRVLSIYAATVAP